MKRKLYPLYLIYAACQLVSSFYFVRKGYCFFLSKYRFWEGDIDMNKEYWELIDWVALSKEVGGVFLVDVTLDIKQLHNISEQYSKEDVLKVDCLVQCYLKQFTIIGKVFFYEIIERWVDDKGNLIVFVTKESKYIIKN